MTGVEKTGGPVERTHVPLGDRWAVEEIFQTDQAWEEAFASTAALPGEIARRAGTLSESADSLASAVRDVIEMGRILEKLYVYASMRQDEDLSDPIHSSMNDRCESRINEFRTAQSWFMPELFAIPPERLGDMMKESCLEPYARWLEELLRFRPFTLSACEEKLLAMSREVTGGFQSAFGKLNDVDMPARLPEIEGPEGARTRLTQANLIPLLEERDPSVRHAAFMGFYRELGGNLNTAAALLDGEVKSNIFNSRARGYPSALEASLFADRVSVDVYGSLIEAIHGSLPVMYRYYAAKRRGMGLEKLRPWDLYVQSRRTDDRRYGFEEAVRMTLDAVEPLGADYVADLERGFENRWVDRYENRGKRSGAYSGGCHDTWPYILHNFTGTLDSVFTLAHEAGHSMHSLLSRRHQPYHMSDYRIILAEVASTLNEVLLADMLMSRTGDEALRAYLMEKTVNDFRTTVFRQTMFAEFEWIVHREVEGGGAVTPDFLNGRYLDLVGLYHGGDLDLSGDGALIAGEWARIPHFYYNFYVYKYATGLASSVAIGRRILDCEPGALDSYMEFLSSGCSRPPLELLARTGVDLATPAPVESAMRYLESIIARLE